MRLFLVLLCCLLGINNLMAQGENNVWTFGNHNGLNFNTTPPTFFQSSNVSLEGCASISDATGNLLFYSNGNDVWTAAGVVMPNGSGILGNGLWPAYNIPGSCAQGVAIIKSVSNSNQYYLFTQDAAEQIGGPNSPGYLRYSLVDMSLNGGDGDVVATEKNIVLDSFMSEKMTVAKGAGCYYWLISHRHNSAAYRAFKVDANGVQPGVSSNGLWQGSIAAGQMKISHGGTLFVNPTFDGIEMGTFDNATGMVSNVTLMDPSPFAMHLGSAFSPDDSKLYIAGYALVQYNLAAYPNIPAVVASKVNLAAPLQYSNLRNGPDGKIYIAYFQNHPFIGAIESPNLAGTACNVNDNALPQSSWSAFPNVPGLPYGHGLGNDIVIGMNTDTIVGNTSEALICFEQSMSVTAPAGYNDYLWSDGITTPTRTLTADGIYHVYSYDNCEVNVDTFKVQFINFDIALGADTAICPGGSLVLDATVAGASYKWQDNSIDPTFNVDQAGTYKVTVTLEGCVSSDTVLVSVLDPYLQIPQQDTLICDDDFIVINAVANPVSTYQWNNGSSEEQLKINEAGTYIVTATNACGTFVDTMVLAVQNCDCKTFIPNAFSPNQDGNNDVFSVNTGCEVDNFSLSIYNRFGQRIFQSSDAAKGWDGNHNGTPVDVGAYFYYIKFKGPRGGDFTQKGDLVLIR